VLLLASVEWVGGACNARLQDISVDGAVAEGETVPPQGIPVILRTVRSTIAAEVVWTGDARFGLRFDQPIDPAALLVEVSRGDRHR
jgi:hypothetical protein